MTKPLVIAIDGPSGSGKSSTAKGVAQRLGLAYLDTGAMYRAVTVAYLDSGVHPSDTVRVTEVVRDAELMVSTDPATPLPAPNRDSARPAASASLMTRTGRPR